MRLRARVALLALLFAGGCALGSRAEAPQEDIRPLVVASDLDNMPFAGVDADGRPLGRDVVMMEALGRALSRPIEWRRIPFETLLPSVQAGLVDVVCATLGVTPEREQLVDFSRPYFHTVVALLVRSGPGEPRHWDELDGRLVAAAAGTTAERALVNQLPRCLPVLENKGQLSPGERLLLGEVDAVALDGPVADALVADSGGALTTLQPPLAVERYALAVPKGRTDFLDALNAALEALERSGQQQRWNVEYGVRPARVLGP